MDKRNLRLVGWVLVWVVACVAWWWRSEPVAIAATGQWTVPSVPPVLKNAGFECTYGFTKTQNAVGKDIWIPNDWHVIFAMGSPRLLSTRMSSTGECNPNNNSGFVTRQEGDDSWYLPSQDIATPPEPGKPFDIILYQQVAATYGGAYSLSGWLASECGDAENGPNPCPEGNYIAKFVGIDPNGGTDPNAPGIVWAENRGDRHWRNIYTSATALTNQITIFARVTSPFQFHNNKGFVDAFSLVRAPLSAMYPLSPTVEAGTPLEIRWQGQQSVDIARIPGGNYDLLYDLQTRPLPSGEWRDLLIGAPEEVTSYIFVAPCENRTYQFRVRARAEQPEDEEGARPNHRYPGVWTKPQSVNFTAPVTSPISEPISDTVELTPTLGITPTLYLPITAHSTQGAVDGC